MSTAADMSTFDIVAEKAERLAAEPITCCEECAQKNTRRILALSAELVRRSVRNVVGEMRVRFPHITFTDASDVPQPPHHSWRFRDPDYCLSQAA